MGACGSKDERGFKEKIRLLREEVKGVMFEMDKEAKSHEKEMVVFAFKESSWKTEKKRLKEEVKMLRKTMEEEKEWGMMETTKAILEQMKKERAIRDEAVQKWKQLYHAIKTELDDLIHRTNYGDGLYWGANESMEALKMEMQAKEETIRALKEELVLMEHEKYRRDREIDILRQSLRIMTSCKKE